VIRIDDLLARIDERDRELEKLSPDECREAAALLREAKTRATSERQRELADELAEGLEARAAVQRSPSASP
jgi:hypothetical protein